MTFPNQTPQVIYNGNAVTTVWAFNFEIPFQSDGVTPAITVTLIIAGVQTPLVLNTDFTVAGAGVVAGGSITTIGAHSPIPNPSILVIQRALNLDQVTTFPNQGFLPTFIEQTFDKFAMIVQQLKLGTVQTSTTVALLPAANMNPFKKSFFVTDATTTTFGAAVVGGGANIVPVYSDGITWRIG